MAKIEFKNVGHSYDQTAKHPVYALKPFSLSWEDGGRYALLGPSGCGKTTMLNIISGLITPSEGNVFFNDQNITSVKTEQRNIAQVFQFPVIYNTMSVYDNLAFPLKCRKFSESHIRKKVNEVAEILNLSSVIDSGAKRLTADQKQLISLGRGLVREDVAAVLMDEPLTVIDPDLKFKLRRKLKEINSKYKTTLIYVTHDQNEAMTFAEKIIVMDSGQIVQRGSSKELFERPSTTFVAYFIGSPAMNIFNCSIANNELILGKFKLKINKNLDQITSNDLKVGIRSEFIDLSDKPKENSIHVKIKSNEDFGNYKLLTCEFDNLEIKVKIKREQNVTSETTYLILSKNRLCLYEKEKLIN
ncbi:MAG: sn-glycerol-3-phosphate import ATP-binding protein UgpC [Deltaproteobacteria bacterium]|jgi:glycerol transport system ATP-binding protein|nr:sn-glycerol-3-phosphate import ATP-binding protein UgpC [Deltaproteobacteria bacterium]